MKGKLPESSPLLTEASSVGLRPQVKRSPNTLMQSERRPSITLLGPCALRIIREPLKLSCRAGKRGLGQDKLSEAIMLPYRSSAVWYNVGTVQPTEPK